MASLVVHLVDVSTACNPMVYVGAITSTTSCKIRNPNRGVKSS